MPREGFSPVQSSAYLHDSDFFVRRKSDLLRYLVLAALGNFGIGGIFTVGLAVRCAKGDGVWRRFATNLLHHHTTTTSTNFHRSKQGLCAGAKPVPPSCRQPPPANKSWHLEEEVVRRSGAGQGPTNFQIGISPDHDLWQPLGRRDAQNWGNKARTEKVCWYFNQLCHEWRHPGSSGRSCFP